MMTNEDLWETVLSQVQLMISPANFATWFRQTSILSQKDGEVLISVPNSFSQEWLKNKYHRTIIKILDEQLGTVKDVKYVISQAPARIDFGKRTSLQTPPEQLEFAELKSDRETGLNQRYLFENFIVGSFNELAQAAAVAVTKNLGQTYNPLFIYGGVGLGKTHLLQAIGNEVEKLKIATARKIRYLSAERFVSEIVAAIRNRQIESLKSKLQNIDLLILDDVQFLAGKEKTQEEFFHLFNALYEKGKQIVLSSDRPPKAINSLTERLRSRFEGGMIADISYPDLETRLAILKTKMTEKKIFPVFSEEVLDYLANNFQKNIRELEGAMNRLAAHQKVSGNPINTDSAKQLLKNLAVGQIRKASPKKIVQAVSDYYDLKGKEVFDDSRKKEVVKPRQVVMFLLREELKYSFPAIGRVFKGKDHTTAIHAFRKIKKEMELSEDFVQEIGLIKQRLYSL